MACERDLLSLIGSLSHACKAVRSGRAFLRRLITLSTSAQQLDHFIPLNIDAHVDIEWWYRFAESWNGVSMMNSILRSNPKIAYTKPHSKPPHHYQGTDPHHDCCIIMGALMGQQDGNSPM